MTSLPTYTTAPTSLFWRSYEVTLDNGDGVGHRYGNVSAGSTNVRLAFSIERQLAGTGARSLTLTNLAPSTIRNIRASALGENQSAPESVVPGTGTRISIKVGYGGALSTLFVGNVLKARTERSGADMHTHVEMIDSESFLQDCVFVRTYAAAQAGAPPTTLKQILRDIAAAMQVQYADKTVRVVAGVALGIPSETYPRGIAFSGTCGDALATVLKPFNMLARVQNGVLTITQVDRYNGDPASVLRPDTGLVQAPTATIVLGRQTVAFKSLMNPRLVPEALVTFQGPGLESLKTGLPRASDAFVGYYKIVKSTFKGDTHGPDWTVDCEALPYDGSLETVPTPL